jgi:hypothetical protein
VVQLAELPEDWREVALEGELSRAQIVEIDAWLADDPCANCGLDLRDHDRDALALCQTTHEEHLAERDWENRNMLDIDPERYAE